MDQHATTARPPDRVLAALRCPVCGRGLGAAGGSVRCVTGHNFDIARQGYLNLLGGRVGGADTPAMVADRAEFLAAGHYAPLAGLLADRAAALAPDDGLVVDAGAGTGYYLGAVLDRRPGTVGLALDASTAALRRAAKDPRIGAVACDVWRPWPVRDGAAAVLVNVFAPRNGPEFHRVLRPDGVLLVVTPAADHLAALGRAAGMLTVDPDKDRRLAETLADRFEPLERRSLAIELTLSPADARRVVGMGPAAFHDRPRGYIGDAVAVTASFRVTAYRTAAGPS
jgi:23S rRNA (guanine745-N1)-methyltransferase